MDSTLARTTKDAMLDLRNRTIYVIAPGGTTAQGGMARMVKYMVDNWPNEAGRMLVLDSYGSARCRMPLVFLFMMARLFVNAMRNRIDLLHIHMAERLSVTRKGLVVYLGALFRIPTVLHLHGAEFENYCMSLPQWRLALVRRMMQKVTMVVALGHTSKSFVCNYLNVDPRRVQVLPNAVPAPRLTPRKHTGPCRILFLGAVCERKGVPTLLSALASPLLTGLDWHCHIVGDGDLATYRNQAKENGIENRLTFHGWLSQEESHKELVESDFLVLPSRNEGLPMAILEAMSVGLPTIATPVGEMRDAVRDGNTGLIVPVDDIAALGEAMRALVVDCEKRQALGHAARELYLSTFDIKNYNQSIALLFKRVLRIGQA